LLLVLVPVTGLYAVALVPAGAGIRWWSVPCIAVGCVVAEIALLARFRSRTGAPARGRMALSAAALSLLLAPAVMTGAVVESGLGSFSTPLQSAAATRGTTVTVQEYQAHMAQIGTYYDRFFTSARSVFAVDTSALAAPLIMATGKEFLPVGGFSGNVPAPTLAQLRGLIDSGRLHEVLVPVSPSGDDPRISWIRDHCTQGLVEPYGAGVTVGFYRC
jgi:hypothetical protein